MIAALPVTQTVSFETVDATPVSEKYRDFINNTRQRDINAYNRMSNPYYLAPSFNKPLVNYEFRTAGFRKALGSKLLLVLVKLKEGEIDDLALQSVIYTIQNIAHDNDEVFILSVINKFDLDYRDNHYYIGGPQKLKSYIKDSILPEFETKVFKYLTRPLCVSINIVFDQKVILSVENTILDFSPSIVILSHHNHEAHESRKPKFLQKIANSNSITSYCTNKLSLPIIVYTDNVIHSYDSQGSSTSSLTSEINSDYFKNLLKSHPIPDPARSASDSRSGSVSRRSLSPVASNPLSPFRSFEPVRSLKSNGSNVIAPQVSADALLLSQKPGHVKDKLRRSLTSRIKTKLARI